MANILRPPAYLLPQCPLRTISRATLKPACACASLPYKTDLNQRFFLLPSNRNQRHHHFIMSQDSGKLHSSCGLHTNFSAQSLFDLTGKVALVTGGGSGIGLMAAQALATNGAKVYISGRTKEKLDRVVDQYGKNVAGEIIGIQADVGHKQGIQHLYSEISKREKCLCILVNNAGVSSEHLKIENKDAEETRKSWFEKRSSSFEEWQQTFNTNVSSIFFMTSAFLPLLEKSTELHKGWSSAVINITSISGMIKSSQAHFAYNASKAAAIHLNRMLANEVVTNGLKIRVNSIAPGVFPSEMTTKDSDAGQKSSIPKEDWEGKVPAGRPGKDEDMAATVLYVATNQYLNGQNIAVDGGYTLAAGI